MGTYFPPQGVPASEDYPWLVPTIGKPLRVVAACGALIALVASCTIPALPVDPEPENVVIQQVPERPQPTVVPEPPEPIDPLQVRIDDEIAGLELREKLAGLMIVTIAGMDPSVHRDFLSRIPAAGFLMLGGNLRGEPEGIDVFMDAIQEGHEFPLLMTVDQEGSPIARIGGDLFPGARTLGAGDLTATAEAFAARQDLVSRAGANVNFGVVADVSQGPGAYIHSRSFSTDVAVVSEHVAVAVEARSPGVAQTLKHFPGHGMVFADTHKVVPRTDISLDAWRLSHALPFIEGIEAGAELVMTAHIRVTSVSQDPASLSNEWIALLRNELGFEGVIITDDLRMLQSSGEDAFQDPAATMVAALVAGNDLLMLAVDPGRDPGYDTYDRVLDALVEAVESGVVSIDQVNASLERVLRLRAGLQDN